PGMRAGCINESMNRPGKFLGDLHDAQGFAITLGIGHAEIAVHLAFGVAPFLMPDHRHFLPMKAGETAYDGGIVAEGAVAMHLAPIGEYALHVIQRVGPLRMPRQLGLDPSALLRRKLPTHLVDLLV